ncbi:serine hydrolase domain-containing protein [Kitasatospora sp. NPDC056731]|uniref:serine hydrolase domain-containing protein n=1 Tax=Kitasatospora sp. NPDC056731 TaxID=3155422 RepID=UPI003413D5CF
MNPSTPYRIRPFRLSAAAVAAGVLLFGVAAAPAAQAAGLRADVVQQRLDALVRQDGVPGALATVRDRNGHARTYTAGVGDLATGAVVPVDGQVRAGSNTKSFTAVAVLQLVAEGKVDLEASLDTYLPGLVRGTGADGSRIDGRKITVHQILQHTSGLPDYTHFLPDQSLSQYHEPRDLLDLALAQKPDFEPGKGWKYCNTGYLIAGLIIQKVTGRPAGEEITRRVIDRIGLRHTYFPAQGDMTVHERHPHGYVTEEPGGQPLDVTEQDMSWAWTAGALVSTNSDLNRFFRALLGGELLAPAQLAQMQVTVPAEYMGPGGRYGLGLASRPLSCGGVYWGHGGTLPGYATRGGVTEDGRAADIAVTTLPSADVKQRVADAVDAALCR